NRCRRRRSRAGTSRCRPRGSASCRRIARPAVRPPRGGAPGARSGALDPRSTRSRARGGLRRSPPRRSGRSAWGRCRRSAAASSRRACGSRPRSGRSRHGASQSGWARNALSWRPWIHRIRDLDSSAMERLLLAWFAKHGRDLPWRRARDPYAILVSEVMLQQTQVERVVPRYLAWLARWPSTEALATAPAAVVIRAWQGLGYNRRGLNLHRAAQRIAAHGWPDDLTELPGVGTYTAAAVANFAFGRAVLPEDTNVLRVQERTGHRFQPDAGQALMDLGATVCLARIPRCDVCP